MTPQHDFTSLNIFQNKLTVARYSYKDTISFCDDNCDLSK